MTLSISLSPSITPPQLVYLWIASLFGIAAVCVSVYVLFLTCLLCVAALALDSFRGSREALYGVFDGDRNVEVPYLLQCTMGDVLAEELHKSKNQEDYMTNTFLTMQRKLGTAGQRLGGSAALCHIRHGLVAPSDRGGGGCFTVTAANVGRCQAVLCRDGKALPLSTTHTVRQQAEYQRARQHHAIITEVHTHCTVCMSLSVSLLRGPNTPPP
ncbi:unnamed protein product, partial [Oncorhynchus mykiss]